MREKTVHWKVQFLKPYSKFVISKLWHNIWVPRPLWKQNEVEETKNFKSSPLTFELLKKMQFSSYFFILKVKQEQKLFSCTFNASQNFPWKNCWHQLKGNISMSRIFQDWPNTEQTYYNDTRCFSGCCWKLKHSLFLFLIMYRRCAEF